ncbi:hypothetical protein PVAG01_05913 [Phlyctema vagabunda]|uniref:Uncharacterized protein n=1 Tax=Phlyctema vagabunda TaxID=108571 RepID=A0ABR4PEP1_9HELO
MPVMESITIINKSGKVVSTGKHLVNIFKDARDAYQEKKAELRAETQKRIEYKNAQKLLSAHEETRSVASSRHSHRSHRSHRTSATRDGDRSRPPLTIRNLEHISEVGSETGSRRSSRRGSSHRGGPRSSSHHGERVEDHYDPPPSYRAPYMETALESRPDLLRRQTDHINDQHTIARRPLPRHSASNPSLYDHERDNVDMNLAYGDLPHPSSLDITLAQHPDDQEAELKATVFKLDNLLLEAQCLQHSATTIISSLQANPEAMAAVALTLAELSNLVTKMSPAILTALKSSSPAAFALLASPQFLIAGGVALGVTVVMFGGFKIIKKIQAQAEARKDSMRMEEAMVFEGDVGSEMSSIDTWRRGIAEAEVQSVATSVSGEFITPEADRQRKERIRERAREERRERQTEVASVRSASVRSESTVRRKDVPRRGSSKSVISTTTTEKTSKDEEKKKKNHSALAILFKKKEGKEYKKEKKSRAGSHAGSHHPRMIEV